MSTITAAGRQTRSLARSSLLSFAIFVSHPLTPFFVEGLRTSSWDEIEELISSVGLGSHLAKLAVRLEAGGKLGHDELGTGVWITDVGRVSVEGEQTWTHVVHHESCPSHPELGSVGCSIGCSCNWFQSCYFLSAPFDGVGHVRAGALAGNRSIRATAPAGAPLERPPPSSMGVWEPALFQTRSGELRFRLGVCSVAASFLIAFSVLIVLLSLGSVTFLRLYLQHLEFLREAEHKLLAPVERRTVSSFQGVHVAAAGAAATPMPAIALTKGTSGAPLVTSSPSHGGGKIKS